MKLWRCTDSDGLLFPPGHTGADGPELKQHVSTHAGALRGCLGRLLGWGVQVVGPGRKPSRGRGDKRAAQGRRRGGPKEEAAGAPGTWGREATEGATVSAGAGAEAAGGGPGACPPRRDRERDVSQDIPVQKVGAAARAHCDVFTLAPLHSAHSPTFRGSWWVPTIRLLHKRYIVEQVLPPYSCSDGFLSHWSTAWVLAVTSEEHTSWIWTPWSYLASRCSSPPSVCSSHTGLLFPAWKCPMHSAPERWQFLVPVLAERPSLPSFLVFHLLWVSVHTSVPFSDFPGYLV